MSNIQIVFIISVLVLVVVFVVATFKWGKNVYQHGVSTQIEHTPQQKSHKKIIFWVLLALGIFQLLIAVVSYFASGSSQIFVGALLTLGMAYGVYLSGKK